MTYESFIGGLKNLQGDKEELERLEEKKKILEYLETGVKGVSAEKIHVSGNPQISAEVRLLKIDEIYNLEEEIELIKKNITVLTKIFEKQYDEIKELLKAIYINGGKKVDVAKTFGFKSDVELERYIKRGYLS